MELWAFLPLAGMRRSNWNDDVIELLECKLQMVVYSIDIRSSRKKQIKY